MAYAALVSLAQTTYEILQHDQRFISLRTKQQIKSTHDHIILLQAFLEDFPEKATSLEGRIRDVANEAEDVIEHFMWEQLWLSHISKLGTGPESAKFSRHLSGLFLWLRRKRSGMYFGFKKLKKVTNKIESMAGEVMKIKNSFRTKEQPISDFSAATSSSRQAEKYHEKPRLQFKFKELEKEAREVMQPSDSAVATSRSRLAAASKDAMVGFEDDLMAIKARLCGESSKLQVIPIFGMGGIGKTTLARYAYDDLLMVEHFQIRAWVTVSQDYGSAKEILSSLLVFIKEFNEKGEKEIKSVEELVYKSLKGRRYLIVMDDMWSTKAWDDVKMIFPDDHNGSRIMLTTRLADVAAYPDSSNSLHKVRFMDVDQSWDLLRQKVFARENCPPELETIGKTIARSCRGLPLAIVVISGLLSTVSKTQASWESIARNVNQAVTTNDEQFYEVILSSSYNHLPQHLRPCFLYMGGFPEDHEIRVSKLIKLWVAEGFLKPIGSKRFEEGAQQYLEDLVKRSLVLVTKRKTNGKIKSCSIHDLVRDLCIRKAHEEKFRLNVADMYATRVLPESIKNQRRVSIAHSDLIYFGNIYGSSIRTIMCFRRSGSLRGSLRSFRLLRILDVVIDKLIIISRVVLPDEVFELFHLRYLALTYTDGAKLSLPPSILNLQNLQTLIIYGRKILQGHTLVEVCLPLEIWRMPQLRHLQSFIFGPLPNPEGAYFALENLQTLSEATNFICTERIILMIPNLKKLGISYSRDGYDVDYHLDNLAYLHQLEKLKLQIYPGFPFRRKLNPVFPTTLKKLALSAWQLPWKDMGVVGSLPNLEVLKLRYHACVGDKWETSEGEFPQLKFLLIDKSDVMHWITESSHFPSLKCLVLHRCRYLVEIPDGIGEIPTLELIEVDDGNKSLVDSAKRIQEEQQSWGNDALQVHCVHCRRR